MSKAGVKRVISSLPLNTATKPANTLHPPPYSPAASQVEIVLYADAHEPAEHHRRGEHGKLQGR
jgi:hypothetical protein